MWQFSALAKGISYCSDRRAWLVYLSPTANLIIGMNVSHVKKQRTDTKSQPTSGLLKEKFDFVKWTSWLSFHYSCFIFGSSRPGFPSGRSLTLAGIPVFSSAETVLEVDVFCILNPCSFVIGYQRFRESRCQGEVGSSMNLWNGGILPQHYTEAQPSRPRLQISPPWKSKKNLAGTMSWNRPRSFPSTSLTIRHSQLSSQSTL